MAEPLPRAPWAMSQYEPPQKNPFRREVYTSSAKHPLPAWASLRARGVPSLDVRGGPQREVGVMTGATVSYIAPVSPHYDANDDDASRGRCIAAALPHGWVGRRGAIPCVPIDTM